MLHFTILEFQNNGNSDLQAHNSPIFVQCTSMCRPGLRSSESMNEQIYFHLTIWQRNQNIHSSALFNGHINMLDLVGKLACQARVPKISYQTWDQRLSDIGHILSSLSLPGVTLGSMDTCKTLLESSRGSLLKAAIHELYVHPAI